MTLKRLQKYRPVVLLSLYFCVCYTQSDICTHETFHYDARDQGVFLKYVVTIIISYII